MAKMDKKLVQQWAAEYKLINEIEREEMRQRLPLETVEESIRSYFALCKLVLALSGSPDEPPELQPSREKHYVELADKWSLLAERLKHV